MEESLLLNASKSPSRTDPGHPPFLFDLLLKLLSLHLREWAWDRRAEEMELSRVVAEPAGIGALEHN